MERDTKIDNIKGFAILLVVFGHVIANTYPSDYMTKPIFRLIYSFHLPLFMFISGYIAFNKKDKVDFLDKTYKLFIPFILWSAIMYIFTPKYHQLTLVNYFYEILVHPYNFRIWFLWILFLIFCIIIVTFRIEKNFNEFTLVVVLILLQFLPDPMLFSLIKWYATFFIIGFLSSKYKTLYRSQTSMLKLISISFFPFLVYFWTFDYPTFTPYIENFIGVGKIINIYKHIVPLFGIALIFKIFDFINFTFLKTIGKRTLDIYVIHNLFWDIDLPYVSSNILLDSVFILTVTFAILMLSLYISKMIRKTQKIKTVLLG